MRPVTEAETGTFGPVPAGIDGVIDVYSSVVP